MQETHVIGMEINSPIDIVLSKYLEYLSGLKDSNGELHYKPSSAKAYMRDVKNAFTETDAFKDSHWVVGNFLDLLPKLLKGGNNQKDYILKLIGLVRSAACQYEWNKNGYKNYKCYLVTFIDYIEWIVCDKRRMEDLQNDINSYNFELDLSDEDRKGIEEAFQKREVFFHYSLYAKFKSRLRRQDRISGDKIWLPLNFIAKIYNPQKSKKPNQFTEWLGKLAEKVYVHYLDGNKVKSVSFESNNAFLELIQNGDEKDVYVILSDSKRQGKRFRVLTSTGKGNSKVEMTVPDIEDIAIDHVKSIDKSLRDLELQKQLNFLKTVSEKYKQLQKDHTSLYNKELKQYEDSLALELNEEFGVEGLKSLLKELEAIGDDSPLRLMASKYNSQKSNGDTFQDIYQRKNKRTYYGIIETGIKQANSKDNKEMTLYQELNNNYPTGSLLIDFSDSKQLRGENINKIEGFKLEDIINRI